METKGHFFVVATPIGNMSDITLRALETLKMVDIIACEDTRITLNLLDKYGISTKVISYHKYNEKSRIDEILDYLNSGKNIALVSDAGTPCISDPGKIIVQELYDNNISPIVIPGACAVSSFLSIVPKKDEEFTFIGFFPRKLKEQEETLEKFKFNNLVFYESPNRLLKTLEVIKNYRGEDTKVAVGRELTKIYEEVKISGVKEIINFYKNKEPKGEIVAMVYAQQTEKSYNLEKIKNDVLKLKKKNYSNKDIATILATLYENHSKNDIYEMLL